MSDNFVILLEDIDHKLAAILEGQESMAHVPRKLEAIEERLERMETKSDSIAVWLKDHDRALGDHGKRITPLESAA